MQFGSKGRRCLISKGRVRPRLVVIFGPGRDHCAGMIEVEEQRLVQKLITHPAIEALDIAVLHRLAGRDIMPLDADLAAPCEHPLRCPPGPVVAAAHPRSAPLPDPTPRPPPHPAPSTPPFQPTAQ